MGCNSSPGCAIPMVCYENATWWRPDFDREGETHSCMCCIYYGLLQDTEGGCTFSSNYAMLFRISIFTTLVVALWSVVLLVFDLQHILPFRGRPEVRSIIRLSLLEILNLLSGAGQAVIYLLERELVSEIIPDSTDGCASNITKFRSYMFFPYVVSGFWLVYGLAESWLLLCDISDAVKKSLMRRIWISKYVSSVSLALVALLPLSWLDLDTFGQIAIAPFVVSVVFVWHFSNRIIGDLECAKAAKNANESIFEKPIVQIKSTRLALSSGAGITLIVLVGYLVAPKSHEISSFAPQGFTMKGVFSLLVVVGFTFIPVTMFSYCHFVNKNILHRRRTKNTIMKNRRGKAARTSVRMASVTPV